MKHVWGVAVVGLLLGLVGGLIVTWFVAPPEVYNTYPPMLDSEYRLDWIRMTTWAHGFDGDRERTERRLYSLEPEELRIVIADVLEQASTMGQPVEVLQQLAELASAYGVSSPGVAIYGDGEPIVAQTPDQPEPPPSATLAPPSPVPSATSMPVATPTLTPTPAITETPAIHVISQTLTCEDKPSIAVSLELSRTVEARGRDRQEIVGLPMREIWLLWDNGADRAITGFRPDLGLGYADFDVTPGLFYNLYVDSPYGRPVLTLQAEPCLPDEGIGWVSRYLILRDETAEVAARLSLTSTITGTGVLSGTFVLTMTTSLTDTASLTETVLPTGTTSLTETLGLIPTVTPTP